MNVLVAGGSGKVGSLILPFLKDQLRLRVLDLVPPPDDDVEYIEGDVNDPAAVAAAVVGMNAVVYMVMPPLSVYTDLQLSHDLNVKGLHQVLQCAHQAGIRRAVYASTASVLNSSRRYYPTEDLQDDIRDIYGFTKRLGERVCEWFARVHEMTIVALRLFAPRSHEGVLQARQEKNPCATWDSDAARAFLLALQLQAPGFHPVFIAGDYQGKVVNLSRARQLLGWEPLGRP